MAHVSLVRAPLVAMAALVGACSMSEKSQSEESGRAADSAKATAVSAERRVSMVMIGKRLGSGNRVTEPTFEFAPRDTVYVSVATEGSGGAGAVTAAWRSQSGKILQQTTESILPTGENTAFNLSQPKGLKPGTYKVVLFLGSDSADAKVFVVKK